MHRTFSTPEPVELLVELGRGSLVVTAEHTTETTVEVSGSHADEVTIEQDGALISVIAPRPRIGFFSGGEPALDVRIACPTNSSLAARTGSADQRLRGELAHVRLKSGSGDLDVEEVAGSATVDVGSGDLTIAAVGSELRVKSGSGDVEVGRTFGNLTISTGSGDIQLGTVVAGGQLKSGSGDLTVERCEADLSLSTASGDVTVGTQLRGGLAIRNVSGSVRVGVPAGIPVWTDVSTVTGRVGSNLEGAGQPGPGEDHLEIRATSVSGDITLEQR